MKKQVRSLLFLLVAAIALGGVYFWMESGNDPAQTGVLYRLEDNETVENISLTNRYGAFQFYKDDGEWVVDSAGQYRTNPEKIALLLSNLELFPISRVLEDSLPAYGLENPRAQVVFTTSSGKENCFSVGAETASKSGAYVRDDKTGTIMITSTGVVSQLDGSLAAYRAKDVLTVKATDIREIAYYKNGKHIVTAVNSNFKDWALTYPFEAPARTIPLNELLTAMRGWAVAEYPAGAETPDMGLANPAHTLVLTDRTGNRQRLEFGESDGTTTYVRTGEGNEIVKLYTVDLNFSALTPDELIFIAPLKTAIDDTKSIVIQHRDQQAVFELVHSADQSTVTLNGSPVSYNDFVSVFSKYVGLNADGREPAGQVGNAIFSFTTTLNDGTQRTLQLAERDENSYYMNIGGQVEYYMEAQKVEELLYRMSVF